MKDFERANINDILKELEGLNALLERIAKAIESIAKAKQN